MIVGISGKKQSGKNTVALIWQYLYDYYNNNYKHPITVKDFKEYVKNNHHLKSVWIQKSFAHKLKQITCILLGCTMEQLEDPIFKETPLGEDWWKWEMKLDGGYGTISLPYLNTPNKVLRQYRNLKLVKFTPRLLLQLLGTDFGRKIIHPNIWINSTMSNLTDNSNWVISDVRFPNEAEAIKDRGGILIRVDRFMCSKCGNTDNFEGGNDLCNECEHFRSNDKEHQSETALDNYQDWNYVIDNNGTIEDLIEKVKQIMFKEGIIYE